MLLSTVLLAIAIATVWLPSLRLGHHRAVPPALLILGVALVAGLNEDVVDWRGAAAVSALVTLAVLTGRADLIFPQKYLSTVAVALAFAMGTGLVPGFNDVVLVNSIYASNDAPPVKLTARFNVAAAGLVFLLFYCRRTSNCGEALRVICNVLPIALITTAVVLGLGCIIGFIRPDIKLPSFTLLYLFRTLLWTCVIEEGFFRGVIQERIASAQYIINHPRIYWLPIAISSVLFGIAHARGGWTYVALATVAGVGYGAAYAKTQRIESSMFVHFCLNAAHFVGFTYPYLEGSQE